MQKIITAILAGCIAMLSLAGCGGTAASAPAERTVLIAPNNAAPTSAAAQKQTAPLHHSVTTYGAQAQAGFYEAVRCLSGGFNLAFTSYQEETQTLLCQNPDCAHADAGCPAWLNASFSKPLLASWGETLLAVYTGNPIGNSTETIQQLKELPRIEIITPYNTERVQLATFDENQRFTGNIATDDSFLYIFIENWSGGEGTSLQTRNLLKINLQSGECQTLATFEYNETPALESVTEEELLLQITTLPAVGGNKADRVAALQIPTEYKLLSVPRTADAEIKTLKSWQQGQMHGSALGGHWFSVHPEGGIYMLNLQTEEETLLAEGIEGAGTDTTVFRRLENNRLIFDVRIPQEKGPVLSSRYWVDITAPGAQPLTLSVSYDDAQTPVSIVAVSEEDFLVIYSIINEKTGTNHSPSYYESAAVVVESRALINKDDFYANQPNYRPIAGRVYAEE